MLLYKLVFLCTFIISLFIMIGWYTKQNKRVARENESSNSLSTKELLTQLKELKTHLLQNSLLQTHFNKEVDTILEEINRTIQLIVESGEAELEPETQSFLQHTQDKIKRLESTYRQTKLHKEHSLIRANSSVEKFKVYIDTNSFYPKPLLFDAHRIEARIQDVKDSKPNQLQNNLDILNKKVVAFNESFQEFLLLYEETTSILNSTNKISGNDKQKIFFCLQNSKFQEAKSILSSVQQQS